MKTARTPAPQAAARQLSLRERKKLKTRIAIRNATCELIEEQGYGATTVEQIADRAEVSPSTVFRYFPTKEDIVLAVEYDPSAAGELVRERPADEPALETLRWSVRRVAALAIAGDPDFAGHSARQRVQLMAEVPALRHRVMESMSGAGRVLSRALAERTGRDEDDFETRVYATGLVGAILEAMSYWAEHGFRDDLPQLVDRALDTFQDLRRQ
ncbi:TetR/AcrR family transcriptional regulator [Streptomyces poonensis]|uniref:TetR family transcriptional regulator n=1 Tax=Streptomyces poonensis TaxID=68255 RepID=A0A918P8R5_9ACTN|nr:TetR family transcriptional regulator [Streptomyces poonensis]GGY91162.1 TetR family transcriptional regulator [Streptomyces poonensis]GLJ87867.1 TetR family transcriptional regulator [Streptomyces poonensis]